MADQSSCTRLSYDALSKRFIQLLLLVFATFSIASLAQGQPPPLGPNSYKSDRLQIGTSILTGFVKTQVQTIVDNINATLQSQGKSIRVQAMPLKSWNPSRFPTEYPDRPNEYYLKLPTIIGINVDIPVAADRQIYIPLDLNISCKGWQTGNGAVTIVAQPGPASIEGGNIIEDVLHIRDYITNQVRSNFSAPMPVTQTLPNGQCVTIGASASQQPLDPFGFIAWDPPPRFRPIDGTAVSRESLQVTFNQLKRLAAHGYGGGVLYSPTENIVLDTYANFAHNQSSTLTMKEGDVVNLTIPPVNLTRPLLDSLVVIANVSQQPNFQPVDSAFDAFQRTANYSPGTHTIQVRKRYVIPAGPGHTKPTFGYAPAYELTYTVRYANSMVVR